MTEKQPKSPELTASEDEEDADRIQKEYQPTDPTVLQKRYLTRGASKEPESSNHEQQRQEEPAGARERGGGNEGGRKEGKRRAPERKEKKKEEKNATQKGISLLLNTYPIQHDRQNK